VATSVGAALNRGIAAKYTLKQLTDLISTELLNDKGALSKHVDRFSKNLFADYDRTVKYEYKELLGLKHAVFAGTVIDTTRDFCEKRVGNVYTEDEIFSWDDLVWVGKRIGVPVVIALGGHGPCRHHLNWISEGTAKAIAEDRGGLNNYN
jgi:hypothetical protein